MNQQTWSRRQFLHMAAMTAAGTAIVACQPQTVIVKETVEVEREKVVKETVQVEKEIAVTRIVEKEVEKIVEVTAAPKVLREAPDLFAQVAQGKLPPVEDRLPTEPRVITPVDEIGSYGGTWRRVALGPNDVYSWSHRLSYDTGLRYGSDGIEIVPHILQGIEVGSEGAAFTFHFRQGLKWSDGEPYTADDLLFWWEDTQMNEALTPAGPSSILWSVNGEPVVPEKVDDYALKWIFSAPYGLFIPRMASTQFFWFARHPRHYLSQFHPAYAQQQEVEKLAVAEGYDDWTGLFASRRDASNLDAPGVKTWLAVKLPPDIPSSMARNPYYFLVDTDGNQLPYIDRLRFEVVQNQDILNLKVLSGAMDMQFRHVSWENYALLVENAAQGDYDVFKWTLAQGADVAFLPNMNHEDPGMRQLMEDKQFRHALSVAIDRDEINEVIYFGLGVPRQASVVPSFPSFKPSQAQAYAQYDPAQANAWLDEIGLTTRDDAGFRTRLDGDKLTINVEYVPFGVWGDVVEMASRYWADVGLRTFPKEMSRPLFSERGMLGTVQDMTVWMMDRAAHPLLAPLFQVPIRAGTPGSNGALWADWYISGGTRGEQPPEEVKRAYELIDMTKTAASEAELAQLATELLDLNAEELWVIGTVGLMPHVGVVKSNFYNVPREALSDWLCLTPGNTTVEQYFFKN